MPTAWRAADRDSVAINEVPKRFRNVATIDIAATLDFEGDIS
jgi:hypothetical protein